MAEINSTREFFNEVDTICTALEALQHWVDNESEKVGQAQYPLIRHFRRVIDDSDKVCGPDLHEVRHG